MDASRREFLMRMARGAAYTAPVIHTLATPEMLLGQHSETSGKGGMGKGCPPDERWSAMDQACVPIASPVTTSSSEERRPGPAAPGGQPPAPPWAKPSGGR